MPLGTTSRSANTDGWRELSRCACLRVAELECRVWRCKQIHVYIGLPRDVLVVDSLVRQADCCIHTTTYAT